jgi:acetolactate synthase-1/2/3 large subunit
MKIAELIVDVLSQYGADRVFSVPGESFLGLLDALYDCRNIDLVTCRHEGSAGLAAVADAKLTGRAGFVCVSRGPGMMNAAIALHVASQEAVPLIAFMGQVERKNAGRGMVQEIDCSHAFQGIIKAAFKLDSPGNALELLRRALTVATQGTPGPVVIELPEDILTESIACTVPPVFNPIRGSNSAGASVRDAKQLLQNSKRPLILVGGNCTTSAFREDLCQFSEKWSLPVISTNKQQDQFSNSHPNWAGTLGFFPNPVLVQLLEKADLILALGTRLGDLSTMEFQFPRQEGERQKLIHVYPDPSVLGNRFSTDLAIATEVHGFLKDMLQVDTARVGDLAWLEEIGSTREKLHYWPKSNAPLKDIMGHVVQACAEVFPRTGIVTTDSGNFASWVHRIFCMQITQRLLGSACGAMGSGVPAALSASLRYPDNLVVAFCGDGGFLMNGNELITAVERNANIKIIISNNKSYGTIRSHQLRAFPGRSYGTDLTNPDFKKLAESFGAKAYRISSAMEAKDLIRKAFMQTGPVVIEVMCDADYSVQKSISEYST